MHMVETYSTAELVTSSLNKLSGKRCLSKSRSSLMHLPEDARDLR